jgi:PAP2 superfamily
MLAGLAGAGMLGEPAHAVPRFPDAGEFDATVPTAWFDLALELVERTPGYSPPLASRAFGYTGVTLYEATVPGMDGYRSLLPNMPAAGRNEAYDWSLVANAALAEILRSLFPTAPAAQQSALVALEARLGGGLGFHQEYARARSSGDAKWQRRCSPSHEATAVTRATCTTSRPMTPLSAPATGCPTPPGFLPALQPFWGSNRCLAVSDGAACPPDGHPPFSEDPASAFHAEAIEVYEAVNGLTSEQKQIARFWSDDPGTTQTPPGHSISITTQVLRLEGASLARAAESYARVGIAVCDAFICCWYQKYVDNLLRPVTYLQRLVDPEWRPLLITPPFPEYPSGHSVQSGAAFQVLTQLFGDGYRFTDYTHDRRGLAPRSFGSFLEAAREAAISRLYGGIHYRSAIEDGIAQGIAIER